MLALFALQALFAAPSFTNILTATYTNALPLIVIAFVISASITALLYMLGNALQSQDILGMAKDNLGNLVLTIILVFMFFMLFEIISIITCTMAVNSLGAQCDHVEAAYQSILILRSKVFSLYSHLYMYEIVFGTLSTLGFSIPIPALGPANLLSFLISVPSISFSPFSGLIPLSNAHTLIVEAVGTAILMVLARQVIIEFIMHYMYVFFVLGVCMRAFTFTRKTGSSLLALATVAYFVYPLAIIFTNYILFTAYHPTNFGVVPTAVGYCEDPQKINQLAEEFGGSGGERETLYHPNIPKKSSLWYRFWQFFQNAADFLGKSIKMVISVIFSFNAFQLFFLILSPVAFSTFYDFLIIELQSMTQFIALVFLAFFVEVVLTITMYRGIALFIEGEAEIFGISKLM